MTDDCATVPSAVHPAWTRGHEIELRNCVIVIEHGPDAGKTIGPLGERTTIGRELWCDIGLTDPQVSKEHCELTWTGDGMRVRDLGSTNGIWYQGMRLYDAYFRPQARFCIGETILLVELRAGTQTRRSEMMDRSHTLVGASAGMQNLFRAMQRIGPRDIPVLLLGETGTGKTAVARAIHKLGRRSEKPFVDVNCAALGASLIESHLFGHVKGAFTGADRTRAGIFEQAAGGTVFLDEIGELPYELQGKLLKVLETGMVRPVGSERETAVDFRLVCATNRNLQVEMEEGRFRGDLFYRIAGMALVVPPLRDRMVDLPLLAEWMTVEIGNKIRATGAQCEVSSISRAAIRMLEQHNWPGNVRELENVIARALALAESSSIGPQDILLTPWAADDDAPSPSANQGGILSYRQFKAELAQTHERPYFQKLMEHAGGSVARAAELSGLSDTYVRSMAKKHGLAVSVPVVRIVRPMSTRPPRG